MGAITLAQASFMALERTMRDRPRSRSGAPNPTRAHVHPNSRRAGTFEQDFFYSYARGEPDRLYKQAAELLKRKNALRRLARAEDRELTEDERLATLITNTALRVFEQLTTLARTCAGKVFPTWEWIEAAAGVSRASVGRALSALARMGLIDKQRRCVPIDPPVDRPKARNAQTSNVYRMRFPNRLTRFLPRRLRPVPLPDDVIQGEADRVEQIEQWRVWRTPRQVVAEDVTDPELRAVLDRLALGIERQSQNNGQPLLDSFILCRNGVGLDGQRSQA
jgi:DNA-binding transcriptional ArsR family regulator